MMTDSSSTSLAEDLKKVGNAAFERKDYMEAIRCYSEAIELDATNHVLFSNRSACYAAIKGKNTEAISDAEKCIALCPSFVKGYYRLSAAKMEKGAYNEAIEVVKTGLEVEPNNPDLNRQLRIINAKQSVRGLAASRGKEKRVEGAPKRPQLDEGTLREMQELSQSVQQTKRDLMEARVKLQACMRDMKKSDLMKKELDSLSDDTTLYQTIGKAFIHSNKQEIDTSFEKSINEKSKEASEAEVKIKYLEGRLQNLQGNLQDIIRQNS